MGIKSIALRTAGVAAGAVIGTCVGNSAAVSFEGLADLVAFQTGNAPLKFGMKNPGAKFFKGYFIQNPYTNKITRVSKKKWLKLMAEQPQLLQYVKLVGGGLILAGTAVVIGKVTYDMITGKKQVGFSKKDLEDFIMSDEFDDLDEDEFMDDLEPASAEDPEPVDSQQEEKAEEK